MTLSSRSENNSRLTNVNISVGYDWLNIFWQCQMDQADARGEKRSEGGKRVYGHGGRIEMIPGALPAP